MFSVHHFIINVQKPEKKNTPNVYLMYYSIIGKKRMTTWMSDVTKKKDKKGEKPQWCREDSGDRGTTKNKIMRRIG